MKLLFDENISYRIVKKLELDFPGSVQVKRLGLESIEDMSIWNYAKKNEFTIVTFDADFVDIAAIKGHPPKIIWLRTGNTTTNAIAELLRHRKPEIEMFIQSEAYTELACLEIA